MTSEPLLAAPPPRPGPAGAPVRVLTAAPAGASPLPARLPGPSARPWRARAAEVLRLPLAVYAGAALLHLTALAVLNPAGPAGVTDRLLSWDARLFTSIASDGYPEGFTHTPDGRLTGNELAFFPGYPALVRAVHTVTGLDTGHSALAASHLALIAALICVHRLFLRLYGPRTAAFATVLVACAQPMAVVFLMGYNESLFLALAAGTLLTAHREDWITAGVLACGAGLTRPVGAAVAAALAVAVLLHARRAGRLTVRPALAAALACCGVPAHPLWTAVRTGHLDGWFRIQEAGWGTRWDNGRSFLGFLGETLARGGTWVPVSTAVLLLAVVGATAAAWVDTTIWPPLLVYGTAVVVMTLGQSNYYHSKLRLLIPALLLLVPAARALARARPRTAVAVLSALALFCSWYGAHMLTGWPYAI